VSMDVTLLLSPKDLEASKLFVVVTPALWQRMMRAGTPDRMFALLPREIRDAWIATGENHIKFAVDEWAASAHLFDRRKTPSSS
jgi:uncharacterized protein (DUF2267 family)